MFGVCVCVRERVLLACVWCVCERESVTGVCLVGVCERESVTGVCLVGVCERVLQPLAFRSEHAMCYRAVLGESRVS